MTKEFTIKKTTKGRKKKVPSLGLCIKEKINNKTTFDLKTKEKERFPLAHIRRLAQIRLDILG